MTKTCTRCAETLPLEGFHKQPRGRHGRTAWCKACARETQREYRNRPEVRAALRERDKSRRATNPVPHHELRRQRLWTWYRTTPAQFEALLASQGGACAVCRTAEPGGRGEWHVDHDHACCAGSKSCGACVRGLLCARCNPMLGMARDDVDVLRAAVAYLGGP